MLPAFSPFIGNLMQIRMRLLTWLLSGKRILGLASAFAQQ